MLVVDDDATDLEAAPVWMPDKQVLVELHARNVVERVRSERPCLVILDYCLDDWDLNGAKLADALKCEHPELPVALVTASFNVRMSCLIARRCAADLVLPKQGQRTFEEILAFVEEGIEPDPWDGCDGNQRESRYWYARRMVARSRGNKAEAARRAGVSWATLHRWLGENDETATPPTSGADQVTS